MLGDGLALAIVLMLITLPPEPSKAFTASWMARIAPSLRSPSEGAA